jgi:Chromosome segregation protein Csm1/Pcs1/Ribosomal L29e protein family
MRGISSLVDTDMEDSTHLIDENKIISSASESELPKTKGARPTTAVKRNTKPKTAQRKQRAVKEDATAKAVGKATTAKRKASEEQANAETHATTKSYNTTEVQSQDELDGVAGGEEPKQATKPKPKRKAKATEMAESGDDSNQRPAVEQQSHQRNGIKKPKVSHKPSAKATQPTFIEADSKAEADTTHSPQHPVKKVVPATSRPRPESMCRWRAGSASDTEKGGGEPHLRRKLGDITRKFENIDLKYRNLKDVGIFEANANVEKLRKQCEATTSASTELIASLKKELAVQMPLAQEARQLHLDLQNSKNDATKCRSAVSDLESSLGAAQNEIKALQAKLAAARSSATCVESVSTKTPGVSIKNSGQGRAVIVGTAEAAQAAQTAQLKEDLYSDLTGLIVRNVKRTEEGDAYDCIQTGRNGSKSSDQCPVWECY